MKKDRSVPQSRKVLIVDEDPAVAQMLADRCAELALTGETACDGKQAFQAALRDPPDLIILDVKMPGMVGLSLCELVASEARLKGIPIIVLTGSSNEELARKCANLGVLYCFKGLETWENLKPVIGQAFESAGQKKTSPVVGGEIGATPVGAQPIPKVLVIDDNPHLTMAMSVRLKALGINTIQSADAEEAEVLAHKELPDVIVTDFHMPGMSGEALIINLKDSPRTRDIPVIVITGDRVEGQPNHALRKTFLGRCGAAAYFDKPLDFSDLLEELGRHITLPTPLTSASR